MNENGGGDGRAGRQLIAGAVAARKRAQMVSGLRGLATRPASGGVAGTGSNGGVAPTGSNGGVAPTGSNGGASASPTANVELCDLCGGTIPEDHRHLLHLVERRIVCSCEACWAMRAGEGDYRPVGNRTLWLADFEIPDDLWASFQIPIGLAFFMQSTVTACVVAMYPSPAGATESELHFDSWSRMNALNPILQGLEPDVEGLLVNRMSDPPAYAIAPIDRCYALTGTIKAHWEGISGGGGVEAAVGEFFEQLRVQAGAAA